MTRTRIAYQLLADIAWAVAQFVTGLEMAALAIWDGVSDERRER